MINNLLCFGLVFIPFYEIITTLFLPAQSIAFLDTRFPKECISFTIALAIILIGLYNGPIRPLKNKWLMFFVAFWVVSINKSPAMPVSLGQFDISNFWVWKPFLYMIVYFLMLVVVASLDWKDKMANKMFKIMSWCGFFMSIYVFLQKAGLDQFFYQRSADIVLGTTAPNLVGTMGQSSLLAPYLAMCLIPSLFIGNKIYRWIIGMALIMTQSEVSIFAAIVAITIFYLSRNPKIFFIAAFFIVFGLATLFLIKKEDVNRHIMQDNGRFSLWSDIIHDLKSPMSAHDPRKYALTGFGPGSFEYMFHVKHQSPWSDPHNEYLKLTYWLGIIGLGTFLAALAATLRDVYRLSLVNDHAIVLMAVLSVLSLIACGTFVWSLAVYQFYTVVIVGMIYQLRRKYEARIL